MGVQGLWELLAPVGRRVSVENLTGKRLAIDASIWMVQFMKAMRDENGEMVRNAHLLGFFRRICKLLFLRTKPVFVFDGATPALKRRTVVARRRHRENAQAKIRKTAERLLLNHLKQVNLKHLADDLKSQRQDHCAKGKQVVVDLADDTDENSFEQHKSMPKRHDQERLDAILAASLAAENDNILAGVGTASTSGVSYDEDTEEDKEDNQLVLPTLQGAVDPNVLASLPPSMQLDLLAQMRERLMVENRQKYQKVKKAPEKFSELQIQSYLKTVAFRREIDEVQKSAGTEGVGGVRTSKIASQTNREFIFSSSYAADKELLTSTGLDKTQGSQIQASSELVKAAVFGNCEHAPSNHDQGAVINEIGEEASANVQQYFNDRGRMHASKFRVLGIRMTRDLQRNLDMMEEMEREKSDAQNTGLVGASSNQSDPGTGSSRPDPSQFKETYGPSFCMYDAHYSTGAATSTDSKSIQISFDSGFEENCCDGDDEIFNNLVAGNPLLGTKKESSSFKNDLEGDSNQEEGAIERNFVNPHTDSDILECEQSYVKATASDEGEVEWEDGNSDVAQNDAYNIEELPKPVSKGVLEEKLQLQEALKRSLQNIQIAGSVNVPPKSKEIQPFDEVACQIPYWKEVSDSPSVSKKVQRNMAILPMSVEAGFQDLTSDSLADDSVILTETMHKLSDDRPTSEYDRTENTLGINSATDTSSFNSVTLSETNEENMGVKLNEFTKDPSTPSETASVRESRDAKYCHTHFVEGLRHDLCRGENINNFDVGELNVLQREDLEASLIDEISILSKERHSLGNQQKKLERDAESVSGEMFVECQELLQMFGLPYIIAPMEAEAQCAFLEQAGLVDGVVTDDSDVFLFGARHVYKNIFNNRQYVETYFMKDIEDELGMSREKLIRMAMLLGSDYTEGISGIGIVNAVEVLHAFPEVDGFHKFREWIESPDPNIFEKKKGSNVNRKSSTANKNTAEDVYELKQSFMDKHRNISKNWHVPSSFPSEAVVDAYISPKVDMSAEPFSHGKPDLSVLRKLSLEKFGWSFQKTDELLLPVMKQYNKHETQLRLEAFYSFNERFAKIRSKRISKAVKGITGKRSLDDNVQQVASSKDKMHNEADNVAGVMTRVEDCSTSSEVRPPAGESRKVQANKRKSGKKSANSGISCMESSVTPKTGHSIGEGSLMTSSGRKRDSYVGGLKRRRKLSDQSEMSFGDVSAGEKSHTENHGEAPQKIRKSTRNRKAVKYMSSSDMEPDDLDMPATNIEEARADTEKVDEGSSSAQCLLGVDKIFTDDKDEISPVVSPLEGLAGGGLEMGFGFCNERRQEKQPTSCENETPFGKNDRTSEDYLKMGGGFCIEEDEEGL